jgi:ketosteroid isomerase-like protein
MHTDHPVLDLMDRFTAALNSHDLDAVMALVTDDIVFESTSPPPDGTRYEGRDAVRQVWGELLATTPRPGFPSRSSSRTAQDVPSCAGATTGRTGTCVA